MKRFREDLQLAPVVAQFVPLKLDTRTPEWQAWARQHPHEGNAIPIVYVVRADGETLYAKTGAPQGDDLPRLLIAHLGLAGKAITPAQANWFSEQADGLSSAMEQEDDETAFAILEALSRKGDPTNLGTFAESAMRIQGLASNFVGQFQSELAEQREVWQQLEDQDEEGWLESARGLALLNHRYRELRLLRSELSQAITDFKKKPLARELYPSAELLVKAESVGDDSAKRTQEARKLRRLVDRAPESLAAKQAIALLENWGESVEAEPAGATMPAPEFREWTDRTGKFKVVALFVELAGDEVVLRRKEGGQELRVPLDRLSSDDRRYLRDIEN
jgi:hypothetical protein